ncbi:YgaP family membrane protein [Maribacter spongiicola]|uniref:YgaP family membrane protein n=1 Tax=Maribacter spongiicola TaxID=1206753 RepID=UPI003F980A3E
MLNTYFRVIVGIMVLLSVVLAVYVHINWLWFTVFIGVNLIQSAFTKWCLLETILKKFGIKN